MVFVPNSATRVASRVRAELLGDRRAHSGGGASAQDAGQSVTQQRQVFFHARGFGTSSRPGVADQGHERAEPTLAEKEFGQEGVSKAAAFARENQSA